MQYLQDTHCCYKRDNNSKYDSRYIVQLVKNYRSHPVILKVASTLFYDNKLEAEAKQGQIKNHFHFIQIHSFQCHSIFRCSKPIHWIKNFAKSSVSDNL